MAEQEVENQAAKPILSVPPVILTRQRTAIWRELPGSKKGDSNESLHEGIDDIKALIDLPAPSSVYIVQVRLFYQGVEYGADRGALTILDGGLHFQGLRTDFSLAHRQTKLVSAKPSRESEISGVTLEYRSGLDLTLTLYPLSIWPAEQGARSLTLHIEHFYEAIKEWIDEPGPEVWQETIGPPIVPQDGLISTHRGQEAVCMMVAILVSLLTGFLGLLLLAVFLVSQDFGGSGILLLLVLVFGAGCVAMWRACGREGRKARTLENLYRIAVSSAGL